MLLFIISKKIILNKKYQRYIVLRKNKIQFDEILLHLYREIVGLLKLIIICQVEEVNYKAIYHNL